jgi:hypothetical protein
MISRILVTAAAALVVVIGSAQAQTATLTFDQAAYITCREAQALQPEPRKALALYLADHAARHHGVMIPDGEPGVQLAHLVRGGCTLAPDAYLFTVIDRAITAEMTKLPKRQ